MQSLYGTKIKYYIGNRSEAIGTFLCWGVCYDEFENGPGNFTTAIILTKDNTVVNVSTDDVQFILEDQVIDKYKGLTTDVLKRILIELTNFSAPRGLVNRTACHVCHKPNGHETDCPISILLMILA